MVFRLYKNYESSYDMSSYVSKVNSSMLNVADIKKEHQLEHLNLREKRC